jgi:LysR family transcriptional regulator, transcriptional activator of nhaA
MRMQGLNLNHLRAFWSVAHQGALTRAAERNNVSQSALSVAIQKLEAQLGQHLFERRGKQLILTEAGRIALDHADLIFSTGQELVSRMKGSERQARQVLRVGAIATLSRNFQLSFLKPLVGRQDVELSVRSGTLRELLAQLEAHALDVVLTNTAPLRDAATAWVTTPIAEQPVSLVGRWDKTPADQTLAQALNAQPVILPSFGSSIRAGFDALMERLSLRPAIAAEVDDMAMLRLLAREGAGLAVVPPIVVRDELDEQLLVEVHRFSELTETFYAVTLARRFPNPLLGELIGGERR